MLAAVGVKVFGFAGFHFCALSMKRGLGIELRRLAGNGFLHADTNCQTTSTQNVGFSPTRLV
jgi:hypothetical protein